MRVASTTRPASPTVLPIDDDNDGCIVMRYGHHVRVPLPHVAGGGSIVGWSPRSTEGAIVAAAKSLVELGLVQK